MVKIVAIVLVCAIIIVYLRNINSELSMLALIGSCTIVLFFVLEYLSDIVHVFDEISNFTGINSDLYKIIFKITAIGYLVEFGADIVEDFGLKSLSNKLLFVGKIIILSICMPIIYSVFSLSTTLFQ